MFKWDKPQNHVESDRFLCIMHTYVCQCTEKALGEICLWEVVRLHPEDQPAQGETEEGGACSTLRLEPLPPPAPQLSGPQAAPEFPRAHFLPWAFPRTQGLPLPLSFSPIKSSLKTLLSGREPRNKFQASLPGNTCAC